MRLVWHIVKKDAWQQRYLIAAIVLTAALLALLNIRISSRASLPVEAVRQYFATGGVAFLGFAMVSALFVGVLVQSEGLAGVNDHWLARPVPGSALLQAKAIAVLLFVVVPIVLFQATVLMVNGFAIGDHWPGLLSRTAVTAALWILPTAALASVTRNWQQLAAGLVCGSMLAIGVAVFAEGFGYEAPEQFSAAVQNATVAVEGCVALALVAWQYFTRRVRIARVAAAVGLVVIVGGPRQFAPSLFSASRSVAPSAGAKTPNLRFALDQSGAPRGGDVARLTARSPDRIVRDTAGRVRHIPKDDRSGLETVTVPLLIDGLGEGQTAAVSIPSEAEVSIGGRKSNVRLRFTGGPGSSDASALVFDLDRDLLRIDAPMNIRAHFYVTQHASPKRYAMPTLNGSLRTFETGHCQSWVTERLHILCQRPYEFTSSIRGILTRGGPRPLNLQVFSEYQAAWPLIFDPLPLPLAQAWGGLSVRNLDRGEEYRDTSIVFEVSDVLARFEQDVAIEIPARALR